MVIYHGSESIIEKPIWGKGKPNNDYGRGFYCTESIELAKEWACSNNRNGYANKYDLDCSKLKILNLNNEKYNILNWLAVLAKNRTYWQNKSISEEAKKYIEENFYVNTDGYDLIIGYRADDSYFTFVQDFASGTISLKKLSEAMKLGKLGEQIVLKSEKAFSNISFLGYENAHADIYYEKKSLRDLEARRSYRRSKQNESSLNDLYIIDIMREGIKNGDSRLQ